MMEEKMKFVPMPRYQMRQNALKKILKENACSGKKILEIGYGAGEVFRLYRKLGMHVYGYDFSEAAYEYAGRNHDYDNVTLLKEKEDIGREKYDFVAACEVLEHIEDDVKALREWREHLVPGGKMIISVPAHQGRWGENDVYSGHYRRYEKEELIRKLRLAGMQMESIYTYDSPGCLVLDGLRDAGRKRKMKEDGVIRDRTAYTKTSGIERDFSPAATALSNPAIWLPVIKLSQLFYKTDWGSAYILEASSRSR